MKFQIDNTDACDPINRLVTMLQDKGFVTEESRVSDYHFNELYFLMKGNRSEFDLIDININKIGMQSPYTFFCECHWSIVEIR